MNPESEDILEEYDLEPFQVDESLFDLGLSAEQQQKIYDARREAAEQFNFLTKKNRNRFLKIKQEIQDKISGMQERISDLEGDNKKLEQEKSTLTEEIQRLNTLMQQRDQEHLKNLELHDHQHVETIEQLKKIIASKGEPKEKIVEKIVEVEKLVEPKNSQELEGYKTLCEDLAQALYWHLKNNSDNIVGSGHNITVKALNSYVSFREQ